MLTPSHILTVALRLRARLWVLVGVLAYLLPAVPDAVCGTTYHVAPDGSDFNSGTPSHPFRSIIKSSEVAEAGDTVVVRAGQYHESGFTIDQSGTASAPITFRAEGDADVVLHTYNSAVIITGDFIVWDGISIDGGYYGIHAVGANDLAIRNATIRNCNGPAIELYGGSRIDIRGCTITNNALRNSARDWDGGWDHAIGGRDATDVVIAGNYVHNNHGEGIGPFYGCRAWTIEDNVVHDNYSVNVYIDTDEGDITVRRNLIFNTGVNGTDFRNLPDGIRISNERAEFVFHDASGAPLPLDPTPGVYGIVIHNNIIIKCTGGIRSFSYLNPPRYELYEGNIKHNTLIDCDWNGAIPLWVEKVGAGGVWVANNLVPWSPTGIQTPDNATYAWSNYTGGSPQFVGDMAAAYFEPDTYRLSPGSAASGAGYSLPDVVEDFSGAPRPLDDARDIGAHEQ